MENQNGSLQCTERNRSKYVLYIYRIVLWLCSFYDFKFCGTVALGGLVSVTLLFAMLANLILLPSLLISLEDSVSNEKVIKEPKINIVPQEDDKKP